MDNGVVQLVGGPCGQHGPYTFYRAFTYAKDGLKRVITLSEFFFVKLWMDSDLVCIGELQMLWIDKNSEQVLASLRLYFLPENTPEGRMDHGEDEVLAISEKVVLRVEDLITWVTIDADWSWGRLGKAIDMIKEVKSEGVNFTSLSEALKEISEAQSENKTIESKCNIDKSPSVIILSYPRYCRYRAMMRRLEGMEDVYLKMKIVTELGGFSVPSRNTRILFCKDTFDYPELEGHELLCNHLAPKLKGRPRGKRKKRSISPGSESNESECSMYNANLAQPSTSGIKSLPHGDYTNGAKTGSITTRRSTRSSDHSESKAFVKKLTSFMKSNHSPIGRIPSLGYKELDLHHFFTKVQKLGGYDVVTSNRIWKSIFEELGGSHASTSAATVMRRHYERFLLPYERHVKGEDYKPLPVAARRRLKSKASRTSTSDADTSEGTSGSENSTPAPSCSNSIRSDNTSTAEVKEAKFVSEKGKTSSLRSVRVKSERAREARREAERTEIPTETIATTPPKPDRDEDLPIEIKEIIEPQQQKPILTNEPITTAATPTNKHIPDKSPSPIESREMPPIFQKIAEERKEPEIIDLDSEVYKNISSNNNNDFSGDSEVIVDVKKQKLDILKQGGLEVTPVRPNAQNKEIRPSVIQQIATHRVEIIPNNKAISDRQTMPPPSSVKKELTPEKKFISNGRLPPKVVQSKSIYVPSERTIYGDPKDMFQPATIHQIQTPISLTSRNISGAGILDLTVKSPQKPTISNYPLGISESDFYSRNFARNPPRMMNSNLEITLVKNDVKKPVFHKPAIPRKRNNYSSNHHVPSKIPRVDEKATITPQPRSFPQQPSQPLYYGGQSFQAANASSNKLPTYYPPAIDLYQNMLQMYLPAMYSLQNPEHLQLYHEILARNARSRAPSYGLPQDSDSTKK